MNAGWSFYDYLLQCDEAPRQVKNAFEHVQNAQIQIILRMREVSSGPMLSIHTIHT